MNWIVLNKQISLDDDEIRREKISRLFEQHGPRFELDSRSFNYYIPKKGSSGFISEKNSM